MLKMTIRRPTEAVRPSNNCTALSRPLPQTAHVASCVMMPDARQGFRRQWRADSLAAGNIPDLDRPVSQGESHRLPVGCQGYRQRVVACGHGDAHRFWNRDRPSSPPRVKGSFSAVSCFDRAKTPRGRRLRLDKGCASWRSSPKSPQLQVEAALYPARPSGEMAISPDPSRRPAPGYGGQDGAGA